MRKMKSASLRSLRRGFREPKIAQTVVEGPNEKGVVTVKLAEWEMFFAIGPEGKIFCAGTANHRKSRFGSEEDLIAPRPVFFAALRAAKQRFREANHLGRLL